MSDEAPETDRRVQAARRTRDRLAAAALSLALDRGLAAVTVEEIAARADVTRRTFSRHFTGKESAVVDCLRADGDRINRALRARPAAEPPLTAYHRAVRDWLVDPVTPAWHRRPRVFDLLRLAEQEPALFAALQHTRVDAQEDSVRIVADRLGTDPDTDLRPAVLVGAGAGALIAAQTAWVRGGDTGALPRLVDQAFAALLAERGGSS
ncbi:TetR family transcriptional regulator [Streptomyces sp. Ru73]|uniref:TetR/AcrR family transcriptional regulator n=1 Tax=Streptomyces sp. Ru73 TaxID=2080748 RepID=UPI000CDD51D3|nr:TetR/AcrR family transcriptional regulator [Streptomyces sp. Ru73]POX39803.1 TetR family transcriptional regulator [Streptomyces sp. Ru73]